MTPAQLAKVDQLLAVTRDELNIIAGLAADQIARHGEAQAVANMAAFALTQFTPERLAELLAVALSRIPPAEEPK